MKVIKYLLVGFIFGIVLTKSEAVSWYRIYEMFHFQSFHMYGIIMTAIATGLIGVQIIKRREIKDIKGNPIVIADKEPGSYRYWIGGVFFGLGWALAGACPGPVFIMLGAGFLPMIFVLAGALIGTFIYGMVKDYLPHGYYRKHLNK
ncbi:MAG: YeeE/YedE family protein [Flavobacterium sp.]|nr:MAG: YeeE/YedE family protein [Flavobacterium sp.]